MAKRLLLLLLCSAFALGAPLASVIAAEQPCATAASAHPCGDCDTGESSGCAFACSFAFSAPAPAPLLAESLVVADRAVAGAPQYFGSIAGPPGLQPPR